jgi:hypothetical protein
MHWAIILSFGTILASIPINGMVISIIWGWFIAPIFNLREITISQAVGISIFISLFTTPGMTKNAERKATTNEASAIQEAISLTITRLFLIPIGTLVIAWIWRTFFML